MMPLLAAVSISLLLVGCSNVPNQGGVVMKEQNELMATTTAYGEQGSSIQGKSIASAMLEGNYESLYSQFSEDMKNVVTLQDFITLGKQFVADVERFELSSSLIINDNTYYVWSDEAHRKGLTAVVDEQQTIVGLQVLPLTTYPETDMMYSQTEFQLPYADEWLVFWGGKDVFLNYHYEYEHIRYAYDFLIMKDGYSYNGDPSRNESYYAFGADVLAPADGEVIAVIDGIADNIPGEMDESQPTGNMVVIQHGNGERSMLAHFKQDSIVVEVGDQVTAGQLLGLCGNSGNSSEAHIHFQVMKQGEDGSELVIPVSFIDGKQWVRGEQATGQ
jgi:hypothetical protein